MHRLTLFSLVVVCVACVACDTANTAEPVDDGCRRNASYSDEHGHCHCDDGFEIQGTACLPISTGADVDTLDLTDAVITGQTLEDSQGDAVYIVQAIVGSTVLRLEGYVGFGAPQTAAAVALTGPELDYASCSVCLLVETNCEAHGDHFHCGGVMMPASGEVNFGALEVGAAIAGFLHNITLRPVAIANDYSTTPLDGPSTAIDHWNFATAITRP